MLRIKASTQKLISLGQLNNYEILTATFLFYVMTLCNLSDGYQGLEERSAPIFRLKTQESSRMSLAR
jgi:hypothetical protein